MKKIIDAIRDLLYNITDYGLIVAVIVIMAAILAWRFDILFNRNIDKTAITTNLPVVSQNETNDNDPDKTKDSDLTANNSEDNNTEDNNQKPSDKDEQSEKPDNNETKVVATIKIPEGSFPSSIGDILKNSNLIKDKNEFLNRSVEMGLDTKLQSGTFEIAVGTSVDNIIKIIAKAN